MESLSIQFQPFFEWLLRTTLQASLLICLILLLQVVLRSRLGVRWHYCLWLLLLVRMAMPWTPESRVSMFNLLPQSMSQRQLEHAKVQIADESADSIAASANTSESTQVSTTVAAQDSREVVTATPQIRNETKGQLKSAFFELADILPLVWLAGGLVLGTYVCASNFNLLRIVKRRRPLTDQKILDLLEDCKSQMGIRTILGVIITDKVKSPALFGFVRPRLLLPEGMIETLDQQELRYILLHELAHLKRHDIYIGWLISLLQVLHWFNPLVWLAFYRMRSDRELACDALVLARMQSDEPKSYGRIIVNLVERFSRPQRLPGMAGILENKAHLKRRITMIARFKKNSYQWSPLAVMLIVVLACVSLPDARRTKASETSTTRSPRMVVRRIWDNAVSPFYIGAPSPDGKYVTYSDWAPRDGGAPLAALELATGKTRRLTDKNWTPFFPIFSPDGKQVAYAWINHENKVMDLRIVGLDGSEPRVLHSDREVQVFLPKDWSADGQHILTVLGKVKEKENLHQIALVNVSDGSVRVVKTFDTFDTLSMLKLSPDGRYIAYSHPSAEGSSKADIFLLTTDGTRETALVEHPADDRVIGWAPDGKRLVFTSDRTGSIGIWVIGVADGKPQGTPELVKPQMGKFYPLGFTHNGSLYYAVSTGRSDVHIATLDPETGKLLGQPVKAIKRFEGYNSAPEWSPDGRYLVCQSSRTGAGDPPLTNVALIIRELESGKVRMLEPEYKRLNHRSLRWSPDGQSIIGFGRDNQGRQGLLQIDVRTVAVTALAYKDPKRGGAILEPAWAPNGKAVFYVRDPMGVSSTEPRRIVRHELATGEEMELCRIPGRVQWLAPSPDGRYLAFCAGSAVNLVSATGGQPRKLTEADDSCGITWTPDGRYLLFGRKNGDAKLELCRIPTQGGEPQETGLTFYGWNVDVRMHPDGRRITFASKQVDKNEVWALENFLPGVPTAKPDAGAVGDVQQTGLVMREVKIEQGDHGLSLSRDGKKLVYPKRKDGKTNLVVRDLVSGDETQITNYETATGADQPVFSPDGKEVAYTYTNQLHIVSLETGEDRRLDLDGWACDWSRDGRFLLLNGNRVLPVGEGSIKKLNLPSPARTSRFSPDGKYVTYVSRRGGRPKIYLYPVSGGDPIKTMQGSRDTNPIWSPNGKVLLFLSQRAFGPEMDLCGVSVVDGKVADDVQVIKPDFGDNVTLISLSETGRLLFRRSHYEICIYSRTVDPQTNQPTGKPVKLAEGQRATWSPDGKRIAYRYGQVLHVMSADGSNDQEIIKVYPFMGPWAWAPDNDHIYIAERVENKAGIYSISISAKERRPVLLDPNMIGNVTCSPDGKRLAFLKFSAASKKKAEVFTVGVDGKNLQQLTSDEDATVYYPAWSPDGKQIAFESGPGGGIKTLTVVSVDDGTSREIFRGKTPQDRFFWASWSTDGSKIAWTSSGEIRIGQVSDGNYETFKVDIGASAESTFHVPRWSADGTKMLFTAYSNVQHLMLMDNFLPTTVASAAK